ncbi:unnamed protein product, partial [Larinioides sclopetarius]
MQMIALSIPFLLQENQIGKRKKVVDFEIGYLMSLGSFQFYENHLKIR